MAPALKDCCNYGNVAVVISCRTRGLKRLVQKFTAPAFVLLHATQAPAAAPAPAQSISEENPKQKQCRKTTRRGKKDDRMAVKIQQTREAARVAIIARVNEELHVALEQLVVALQCEHVSMTASGAPSSVSAS